MTLKLRGLEGVLAQLKEVSNEMGDKALKAAGRVAFKRVADMARQLVPVDSGDLREAITIRAVKLHANNGSVAIGIQISSKTTASKQATLAAAAFGEAQVARVPPSRRWHWIELGTSRQAPKPFLRPALDANAQAVIDDLSEQLRKKIAAAVKKASKGAK